ncbi:MAG: type 1 glutamine amidotransferase [Candidatus Velamenicoccus archaeovorus]
MKKILIIKHIDNEGPGTLGTYLSENKIGYDVVDVWKDNGAGLCPLDLSDIGGVVIMGGPMNVYEEEKYPFLTMERYLIRELVMQKIPVLGICLGAQLVAVSLGGRVKKSPAREIGWYGLDLTGAAKDDPLMKNFDVRTKVFQWHEDTFELPAGGVLLAQGNGIHQAFSFQDAAWGFQFHVEVDGSMLSSWFRDDRPESRPGIRETYEHLKVAFDAQAKDIYEGFVRCMRSL